MPGRRRRWFLSLLPLPLIIGGLALYLMGGRRSAGSADTAGLTPFKAERVDLEDTLTVNGLVKPAVTIEVRAEASGMVEAVPVNEGDRVKLGQLLVRLDSRVAESAVHEAEASLKQAEMQETAAKLDLDEDTVKLRVIERDRQVALAKSGLTSAQQVEAAEYSLKAAQRALERAKRNLESSGARLDQLRAAADRARAQLQHTIITSPMDAWVIRRQVEVGSGVAGVSQSSAGGTILMTLGDAHQASLSSKVTAADAKKLKAGLDAKIQLDSDPGKFIPGRVQMISAAGDVDQQTRLTTFPVTISVTTQDNTAWINIPAQAEILIGKRTGVVAVPDRCLRSDVGGKTTVLVSAGAGAPVSRPVELGIIAKDKVEIKSGVEAGETLMCRMASGPTPGSIR